ncbi:nucleotide sugar dehydrogenase [Gammaproteobacteria bacterium]|nr:nucleotide sugar dehydrogenase [Gammaproteobacteria bacterium]
MNYKISIVGMGYVGCGNALLLAKNNEVSIVDIDEQKVKDFNAKKLPISDQLGQKYLLEEELNISASTNLEEAIENSHFTILALPTDFNDVTMEYDTEVLDAVAKEIIDTNKDTTIIIKSTVSIGYTERLKQKLSTERIIFSPEFLREGHALEDNLYPSRIIIGSRGKAGEEFGKLLSNAAIESSVPMLLMDSTAAESVKLFSNTYLAMRVSYFNELDTFCLDNLIDPKDVIQGVSLDKRIGNFYNNPSFGFGGYCLPKDSKQLLQRFGSSPHDLMQAIQDSNAARSADLSKRIIHCKPAIVGIYKVAMKEGSDNCRDSSIFGIIRKLVEESIQVIVYDRSIKELEIEDVTMMNDFKQFTTMADLIVTNRIDEKIEPFSNKIFSRDIFSSDE